MANAGDSRLEPGATYVYERADGVIYARKAGETDRVEIGYDYKPDPRTADGRPLHEHLIEDQLWGDIRRAARNNPALQDALERAIVIYELSKQPKPLSHHPV
jgi:hypothetical protein